MFKAPTFIAAGALALTLGGTAQAQTADTVLAVVDGVEITLGELIIARTQLPQQYDQFPPDVLYQGLLDQMVQQQAAANTLEDTPARVEYSIANTRRSLMAGEIINEISAAAVTDDAIQSAYDDFVSGQTEGTEFNASHLLVETLQEAQAARERITGGEVFADVAREVSTGPSGPNGGSLGWFGAGSMVPAFESAVQKLAVGDVSEPVETQFGWHVIILNETRQIELPSLEDMRDQLTGTIQQDAVQSRILELVDNADVTITESDQIDPALINDLSLLEP